MTFDPSPDINALRSTAKADMIAARLLWNLGLMAQSLWLQQQSAEKYLKVLWVRDKIFTTHKEFDESLRKLSHDLKNIFDDLPSSLKSQIKRPFVYIKLSNLRYAASFGTSYEMFRQGELFIKQLRTVLGEVVEKTHLQEWMRTSMRYQFNYQELPKVIIALKAVLAITNPKSKKEKASDWRRFDQIVSRLRRNDAI